jgi:uncharacterized Zn finger protein
MSCPKCKAKIGITKQEVILASGVVQFARCVICGYWSHPNAFYTQKQKTERART